MARLLKRKITEEVYEADSDEELVDEDGEVADEDEDCLLDGDEDGDEAADKKAKKASEKTAPGKTARR